VREVIADIARHLRLPDGDLASARNVGDEIFSLQRANPELTAYRAGTRKIGRFKELMDDDAQRALTELLSPGLALLGYIPKGEWFDTAGKDRVRLWTDETGRDDARRAAVVYRSLGVAVTLHDLREMLAGAPRGDAHDVLVTRRRLTAEERTRGVLFSGCRPYASFAPCLFEPRSGGAVAISDLRHRPVTVLGLNEETRHVVLPLLAHGNVDVMVANAVEDTGSGIALVAATPVRANAELCASLPGEVLSIFPLRLDTVGRPEDVATRSG
jgi:hypothetical protein